MIVNLAEGYLNLGPNDKLEKLIENLIPHYKIQIQLQFWRIDQWNNEIFYIEVDDQIQYQTILETTDVYSICGSSGLERIINIGINLTHSQSICKITMSTNNNPQSNNAAWGIRAFNLYAAKCFNGCDLCLRPLKTQCTVCSSGWIFYHNLCTYPHPMFFSQIQITQIKNQQSNEMIPMEINLIEVNQHQTFIQKQLIKIDYLSSCQMLFEQKNQMLIQKYQKN